MHRYLSQKYFQDFKLTDEGAYWETGDEKLLDKNFKAYNDLVDGFAHSVKNYPIKITESFSEYFERIMKMLNEKRNSK